MPIWMAQIIEYSSVVGLVLVGVGLIAFVWAAIRNGQINADHNLAKSLSEENDHLVKKTNYLMQVLENYDRILRDKQQQLNNLSAEMAVIDDRLRKVEFVVRTFNQPIVTRTSHTRVNNELNLPLDQPILNKRPVLDNNKYGSDNLTSILDSARKSI